jgi:predicted metal-dependent phosphoesterase TrpH
MVKKLNALGLLIGAEDVFKFAQGKAPGRPHVAMALLENKQVDNFKQAFDKYIEFNGPAYVPHYKLSPQEAIQLIRQAGGVAVYSHPAVSRCDWIIPELIAAGLLGIEAYYATHNQSQTQHYLNLAKKYGLLVTGGSDYHGFKSGREVDLGQFAVPDELVDKLKNEYLHGNRFTSN